MRIPCIFVFFLFNFNLSHAQPSALFSNFLTIEDLTEGYFYNSKSRSTDRLGMYWICGDTASSQFKISCLRYDYEAFDSDLGCLSFSAKIKNQKHQFLCQARLPYNDCACQAKQLKKILKKTTRFCILANAWDMLNKDDFFKKELSWVYFKTKTPSNLSTREDGCKK